MSNIDHIVYVCSDLENEIQRFQKILGIKISYGGRHLDKGTHNALFRIGERSYFELLAPDPERDTEIDVQWLGAGEANEHRISAWCVQPDDISQALEFMNEESKYNYALYPGSRKKSDGSILSWKLGLCDKMMKTDVFPFLIDWAESQHPSSSLPLICNLESLKISHACPEKVLKITEHLNIRVDVEKKDTPSIQASISCPNGLIVI